MLKHATVADAATLGSLRRAAHFANLTYRMKRLSYLSKTGAELVASSKQIPRFFRKSPFDWFVARYVDPAKNETRYVLAVQGSNSPEHWKFNLKLESVRAVEIDGVVHRGAYEAMLRIFDEVTQRLARFGEEADRLPWHFCGHSMGGSVALLLYLAGLTRNYGDSRVFMFGSPSVLMEPCFSKVHDATHVVHVVHAYDVVPRLLACDYGALANFVSKPPKSVKVDSCNLDDDKDDNHADGMLYTHVGSLIVMQPDAATLQLPSYLAKYSRHPRLPNRPGLYRILSHADVVRFMNDPHPLTLIGNKNFRNNQLVQKFHNMDVYNTALRKLMYSHAHAHHR